MYCALHERKITRIPAKFENKTPGIETKRRAARGTFLSPTRTLPLLSPPYIVRFFVLIVVIFVLFYFFLPRETTKSRRSRARRRKARSKLAPYEREKRFQSKKGRSAPHIPPVVSAGLGATEPLRGSTIRGLSDAQCESTPCRGENDEERRSDEPVEERDMRSRETSDNRIV